MKSLTHWTVVSAAALCLCGAAVAQDSKSSTGCPNSAVNASGTGGGSSAAGDSTKGTKSADAKATRHAQQLAREQGTLPAAFPQCAGTNDRAALAECVSAAVEQQQGGSPC